MYIRSDLDKSGLSNPNESMQSKTNEKSVPGVVDFLYDVIVRVASDCGKLLDIL
jgi:hypothetical protein